MKLSLGGIADAFADRNFRFYSIGAIVSWLSFFVQAVAVSWTAWNLTHSTRWLAIVALADAAPNIALMPLGGVIADRFDRFRVLMASYALAMLQAAVLTVLALAGRLDIAALLALASAHGAIHAFSIPAQYGFLPRFIAAHRLPQAIGVAAAYTQLGYFLGPALAGFVLAHWGAAAAFASNVAGYAIYFACVAQLRAPPDYAPPRRAPRRFVADLAEGLAAILDHRGVLPLLALMLSGEALSASIRQMAPALADSMLGAGVAGLSTLLAAAGIGATISALWIAHGGARRLAPRNIVFAFAGFLACATALTAARDLAAAAAAMLGLGLFYEVCRTGFVALLQVSLPDRLRGRVMSSQFLAMRLAGSLGAFCVGVAAGPFGLRLPILTLTLLGLLLWAGAFRARRAIARSFGEPNGAEGGLTRS